jgi:NADH-quinone oxidoreductase subunit M
VKSFPILTAVIVTPILGALLTLCVPARRPELARAVGYMASAATLGLAGWLLWDFNASSPTFQFVEETRWFDALGVGYIVGVDGFSIFMVAVTALLFPIGLLASAAMDHRVKAYTFWFLMLEGVIMGIFLSLDLICFFIFWEAMLVPMYFLIAGWGSSRRVYAAMKFFIYTAFGSALMLAGIIALAITHAQEFGQISFQLADLMQLDLGVGAERWLFAAFALAFAIKVPVFPLHTWLPDAHTEAPTAGSILLAGVMLKLGTYGLLRFNLSLFPEVSVDAVWIMGTLAVIGIVYGAAVAIVQPDLKRLVAYSSVSHLGFIVLGTFALTSGGLQGAVIQNVNHGLTTGALFLLVGMIYDRRHTKQISEFGGLQKVMPLYAGFFLFMIFASIGLPGLNGFVGEFLVLIGSYTSVPALAVVAATGVILAAVYFLWAYERVFTGLPEKEENLGLSDLSAREISLLAPMAALVLVLGLYPNILLDKIAPSTEAVLDHIEASTGYVVPEPGRLGDVFVAGGD